MKKIKTLLTSMLVASLLLVPVFATVTVGAQADIEGSLCEGANLQVGEDDCAGDDAQGTVNTIIATVINIFSLIVGVASVIMIIIGGLRYITSGGDSNNITGAKNTIIYAIIGLVVVALAQVIVRFVLTRASTL